jgi:Fe-S cluster assembly scaffold protein SufB
MVIKSVKNVPFGSKRINYWQIDHEVRNILPVNEVTVLPSPQAWQKFSWTRKYFEKKPKEGYFVWVKKQPVLPLTTCITIASKKIYQRLNNLLVIEKNIKAKARVICHAAADNLCGLHQAQGKLILKDKASLEYNHFHQWGQKDSVNPDYQFVLGKGSRLIYNYKNLAPPKNLQLKTSIYNQENASANLKFAINGLNSEINLKDTLFLEGKNSQGIVNLRLVGRQNSQIEAISEILAQAPAKGHLDCQGLLVSQDSVISLIPKLVCQNKKAQLTHEASIGKISEEELNYLRSRGLSEKEAINLIITGFLEIE